MRKIRTLHELIEYITAGCKISIDRGGEMYTYDHVVMLNKSLLELRILIDSGIAYYDKQHNDKQHGN